MVKKLLAVKILVVAVVVIAVQIVVLANNEGLLLFKGKVIDTSKESPKSRASFSPLSTKKVYVVIQFKGSTIEEQSKKDIQKIGGELLSYVPNNAFIARAQEKQIPLFYTVKSVKWIGEYEPTLKIDPKLLKNEAASENQKIDLHIRLFSGETSDAVRSIVEEVGGTILYERKEVIKASVIRKAIEKLSLVEGVEWIEEAKKPKLLNMDDSEEPGEVDPYEKLTGFESGSRAIQADVAYEAGISGNGQIVGMADTGLDLGNVNGQMSLDFQNKVIKGYSLGLWADSWADEMGHGTHVMGSILGSGAYSRGIVRGVAYDAKAVVQGLLGPFGDLNIPSDLNDLFEPVYDDGVRVHSNSWGHPVASYDQLARSLDQFVWNHPDMVITVAGGNDGIDNDKDGVIDLSSLLSPAVAKNCITVGASENYVLEGGIQKAWGKLKGGEEIWGAEPIASDLPSDNPNGIAAFSSRGPTSDGRIKPDVVAPGTNVLSARSHHPKAETLWGEFSPDYVWSGGTSMATPLTAGAATLVRQFYTDQVGLTSPSAALIKATLINSADDIYPGQFGFSSVLEIPTPRPNAHEGWGRVNIGEAVSQGTRSIQYWDDAMGVKKGITKEYRVAVTDLTKPLRATLVYTDYPATTSAAKSLVNDLDLQVISSSGRKYFANGETTPDRTNNVEGIDILKPTKGEYIVRVVGYNIPKGKNGAQPYALVISGGF
ncbi:MAG: hypothetical protein A2Z91_00130 [Deltaproteobacteria bacterium GWA2_38_16]|nr:MAG: hypothetical protein A2Z91_00130 [Deltaproteobacteria bacterium GWA2_38_16]OGQ03513.1 MAG: hypothetical protein A3D19_01535 [Deltaproteobacteria bacterium RIFCSPHIGHO2_02_FULL_38_15]HBQ21251.1 serine protease [Deltaproteobacteria bacterium]